AERRVQRNEAAERVRSRRAPECTETSEAVMGQLHSMRRETEDSRREMAPCLSLHLSGDRAAFSPARDHFGSSLSPARPAIVTGASGYPSAEEISWWRASLCYARRGRPRDSLAGACA